MEKLIAQAERMGHRVLDYRFARIGSVAVRDTNGVCTIGLDRTKLRSRADGRVVLAHELGHCETGAFYTRDVTPEARGRREERADRWAIRSLMPYTAICAAIRSGARESWALAEAFDVTEAFASKAVAYYRDAKGLPLPPDDD